jgi:hypothetical protein
MSWNGGGGAEGHSHTGAAFEYAVLGVAPDVLATDESSGDGLCAGDVYVLSSTHACPPQDRRQTPGCSGRSAEEIRGEGAVFQGRLAGMSAVAAAGSGEVVGIQVVAIPVGVRTRLAEGGDGDHHQVGVHLGEGGVVEAPLAHLPRRVVLDQHVGPLDEAKHLLASARRANVQGDAALVRVEEVEQAALLGVRLVVREGAPAPGDVSVLGHLDLDDVGPVVGEQLGAVGRRDHLTEFEDPDAFESGVGHFASFQWTALTR